MRRSFGSFLIIMGVVISIYALSAYNLYTASDPIGEVHPQSSHPVFYLFFSTAIISIIGGIALLKTDENATQ